MANSNRNYTNSAEALYHLINNNWTISQMGNLENTMIQEINKLNHGSSSPEKQQKSEFKIAIYQEILITVFLILLALFIQSGNHKPANASEITPYQAVKQQVVN